MSQEREPPDVLPYTPPSVPEPTPKPDYSKEVPLAEHLRKKKVFKKAEESIVEKGPAQGWEEHAESPYNRWSETEG